MVVVTVSAIQFRRICAIIVVFSLIAVGGSSDGGRFDRQNELTTTATVNNNYEQNNQRSLSNYVVTSVPYLVNNKSIISQQRPSQWQHNIFSNTPVHMEKGSPPELIIIPSLYQQHQTEQTADCVGDEGGHCLKNSNTAAAAEFNNNNSAAEAAATFKPYSQEELNKILEKYGEKLEAEETSNSNNNDNYDKAAAVVYYSSAGNGNSIEPMIDRVDQHDKSKSWNLISSQNYNKNNHPAPYEDKTGWVTLEPIAWSSSQVQKWEPNQKPMWPSPSQIIGNSGGGNSQWNSLPQQQLQPSYSWTNDRPFNKRPAAYQYQQQKPWNSNQNFGKPPTGSANGGLDILTDGQPGYFPADRPSGSYKPWPQQQHHAADSYTESTNRPSQTQLVYHQGGSADRPSLSNSGSGDGDGHWVLLSSTKGYSVPHRQRKVARSLNIDDDEADQKPKPNNNNYNRSRTARRTVRLTVLPPIAGTTKTEMSHGGMIEVESTKQTVDEAHREHLARMMRLRKNDSSANELRNNNNNNYYNRRSDLHVVTLPKRKGDEADLQRQSTTKNNAVLAAVSAGMIPATMAMLVPLILGRRKRSIVQHQQTQSRNIGTPAITTPRYARAEFKNNNNNPKKRLYANGYYTYQ